MAGVFGYELNLNELSDGEKDEIRCQIAEYKKHAALVQQGDYYRLTNPQTDNQGAWEFVSRDQKEALVQVVGIKKHANMTVDYSPCQRTEGKYHVPGYGDRKALQQYGPDGGRSPQTGLRG